MEDSEEVEAYLNQLSLRLQELGVEEPYYAWYLVSNYGQQSEIIVDKVSYFLNEFVDEQLIRAELWYCVHHEMTNGLSDFFVRRSGRLYFDIHSIYRYRAIVEQDLVKYLGWDEARLARENAYLDLLLDDATTYYDHEFE